MDSEKQQLRSKIRSQRSNLDLTVPNWQNVLDAPEIQSARTIASYLSYMSEPNTEKLNASLIQIGKNLVLPRLLSNNDLIWVKWDGRTDSLSPESRSGYREPMGEIFEGTIDVVIIPALAIDQKGNRLGQGGGSFDRALSKLRGWKIALVYDNELVETKIPVENHDQPVDAVATPLRLIRFN